MEDSGGLPPGVRALVRLSAALAVPDETAWREALDAAARRAGRIEVEEVLLQAHLFVGFPVVLNAFGVWRRLAGTGSGREGPGGGSLRRGRGRSGRTSRGRDEPVGPSAARAADGEALCRAVYGGVYERLRRRVRWLHPELDRWMVGHGYGSTLTRPGLSAENRELCLVALLAAGGHEPQLGSHLRGALNVGASAAQVKAALAIGIDASREAARRERGEPERLWALWADVEGG